jgi:hypothetical protein
MNVLLTLLVIAPLTGLLATAYLVEVWRIRPRSILVGLLTFGAVITEVVAFLIAPLAWEALAVADALKPKAALVGIALLIQLAIPHAYAVSIYLLRRRLSRT